MNVQRIVHTGRFVLGLLLSLPAATALAQPSAARPKTTLLLVSEVTCTVKLDGEKLADLRPDEPKKVEIDPGEHLVSAATPGGQKWSKVVEARVAAQTVVKIDFALAPAAAREAAEQEAARRVRAVEEIKTLKLPVVTIPAGTFKMGCSPGDNECNDHDENPRHAVDIAKPFEMMATEVTAGQFRTWALSQGYEPPGQPDWSTDDVPVVNVTWNDAQAFCSFFGGRLPTEAEWEYAARGGSEEARFGPLESVAWFLENSGGKAHPVGKKSANAFGLYDTLGNVWEWCADWYGETYYKEEVKADPAGPSSGKRRVIRGGSWINGPRYVRVSNRYWYRPVRRLAFLGFRCVRDPNSPATVRSSPDLRKARGPR